MADNISVFKFFVVAWQPYKENDVVNFLSVTTIPKEACTVSSDDISFFFAFISLSGTIIVL